MARIRLNLKGLNDDQLLAQAHGHDTAMEGNANFPTPSPAAQQFQGAITDFETSLAEQRAADQTAQERTSAKNDKRSVLEALLKARADYVENTSGGDETKILSASFGTRAPASPVGIPAQPTNFVATMSDLPGCIDLMWDRVRGASTYVVQICPDPLSDTSWRQIGLPTKSSFTATGLTAGSKYWFRVAAIGAAGQGPWSDQSMKMAP
jgi:hypothetical protein